MAAVKLPEDVAKVYDTTAVNPKYHVPGVGDIDLSNLTMTQAERLEKIGWKRLQKKASVQKAEAKEVKPSIS